MKANLCLHDWSVLNNRLDSLLRIKNHFKDFKVTLFAVPDDIKHRKGDRKGELKRIKECLSWVQIVPHGLQHNSAEVIKWDYHEMMRDIIPAIVRAFNEDGLPFDNGFCPPHWKWNLDVVKALDDLGWWGAISRDKPMPCTKLFYKYSHSIDEPFTGDTLKLYGHVDGTSKNDLDKCIDKILELPKDTEWVFVNEFIEKL